MGYKSASVEPAGGTEGAVMIALAAGSRAVYGSDRSIAPSVASDGLSFIPWDCSSLDR